MKRSVLMRCLSVLLALLLAVPLFLVQTKAAGGVELWLEAPDNFDEASDVTYDTGSDIIANWGVRGEHATFLTDYAESYYTGEYAYETISAFEGDDDIAGTPSSDLYKALSELMNGKSTSETSYEDTKNLYKYTDCMVGDNKSISSFYSGVKLTGEWDSAATWNREHVWPNSKIDGNGENDIMMLRPTWVNENSGRGSLAYGESEGFYDPDFESEGFFSLHGDCARIILYTYVRWGVIDTMWGEEGVIENLDVLLKWMKEDPVDTWEMGRNDAVQSITGVRNVFVDYPELAWLLFEQKVPEDYISPSSVTPESGHFYTGVVTDPTCTEEGYTTYTCPVCGSTVIADETEALGHTDADGNHICDVCGEEVTSAGIEFKLYTGELIEGDYLIVSDGKALQASSANARRLDFAVVTEGESIITDETMIMFHIAKDGDDWTIYNEETGLYVGGNGTKNQANMLEGVTDQTLWTASMADGKFEFVNKYNKAENVNSNLRCNGNNGWACYSTGTGSALTLYRYGDTPEPTATPEPTETPEPTTTPEETDSREFKLYTDELKEGDYLIVYDGRALEAGNTVNANRLDFAAVTEGESILCDNEGIIFRIAKEGDYWTIFNEKTGKYVAGTGSKNKAVMEEEISDKTLWTAVMTDGKYEFINKNNEAAGVNSYLRNNGDYGWACYSTGTGDALTLYREDEAYTVTWANEDGTVLETDEKVPAGSVPAYDGETPVKASDGEYTYTFAGWDKDTTAAVTGDITFTAVFDAEKIEVTPTIADDDSSAEEEPAQVSGNDVDEEESVPPASGQSVSDNTSGSSSSSTSSSTSSGASSTMSANASGYTSVPTSDDSNMILWAAAAVLAVLAGCAALFGGKKREA